MLKPLAKWKIRVFSITVMVLEPWSNDTLSGVVHSQEFFGYRIMVQKSEFVEASSHYCGDRLSFNSCTNSSACSTV